MPINIELKAKVNDLQIIREKLSNFKKETLKQKDTFINFSPKGRLKIRCINDAKSQLIYYERDESRAVMSSKFNIYTYSNKEKSRKALKNFKRNYGVICVVNKYREYYRDGSVRIHLDNIEKLGNFVEIEVVVSKKLSESDAYQLAQDYFFYKLSIPYDNVIHKSYVDIFLNK